MSQSSIRKPYAKLHSRPTGERDHDPRGSTVGLASPRFANGVYPLRDRAPGRLS